MASNYPYQPPEPNRSDNQFIKAFIAGALVIIAVCCLVFLAVYLTRQPEQPASDTPVASAQPTETPVAPPQPTQAAPASTPAPTAPSAPASNGSWTVESEVSKIRTQYYNTQDNLKNYSKIKGTNGATYYYNNVGQAVRVDVGKSDSLPYSKQYYFQNGKLYFAFIFDGKRENRLYFKDDQLIRLKDEYGNTTDMDRSHQDYVYWETNVLYEAYGFYS